MWETQGSRSRTEVNKRSVGGFRYVPNQCPPGPATLSVVCTPVRVAARLTAVPHSAAPAAARRSRMPPQPGAAHTRGGGCP